MVSVDALAILGLQLFRNGFFDISFYLISFLFEFFVVLFTGILLLVIYKRKECSLFLTSLLTTGIVDYLLKNLFRRPRPGYSLVKLNYGVIEKLGLSSFTSYSFPSGHTAVAFLVVSFLAYFRPKYWYVPAFLAFLVPISRVYLGVHFPTDVLFGMVLGLFIGAEFILHRNKVYNLYDRMRNSILS